MAKQELVMLAKEYVNQDVTGWLMSEKLDGVRAFWTGSELITRTGKPIFAPSWFLEELPAGHWLDGELWIGRGMFQQVVSVVRKKVPLDNEWRQVLYRVFAYDAWVDTSSVTEKVTQIVCKGKEHLDAYYSNLLKLGAEGVMLRHPTAPYERTRSKFLLKYKPTYTNEATLLEIIPGKGKHEGRAGAYLLQMPGGLTFEVGTGQTDKDRENPPPIGSNITYECKGWTDDGKPRHPVYIGVRDYE